MTYTDRALFSLPTGKFFAEIDRKMGGLPNTSTLLILVYYIRETTRRLQAMHTGAGAV